MQIQNALQTAGNKNISDIIGYGIMTENAKNSINLSWNYNSVNDLNVATTLRPASITGAVSTTPTNNFRSNSGSVINNLDYMNSYNRLKVTFPGIVRTVPFTVATEGLSQLIGIDPASTTNKLFRIVARSGATANATLKIFISNSSTVYKEINVTLPIANTEYVIDDIDWQTDTTYGAVTTPVVIDGISKATTTAVVTSTGTLPANGTYQAIFGTGTLGAEIINTSFYNNEFQKYGAKIPVKFCCYTEPLVKVTKELQDILCRDNVIGSYTKKKSGEFTINIQKYGTSTVALLQGSDVFETVRPVRTRADKIKTILSGANIVVPLAGNISDVSIDCTPLIRTTDNLTSANIASSATEYNYSVNTTTGSIVFSSTIPAGTVVEIGYMENKVGQSTDLMQLKSDIPMVYYWTVDVLGNKNIKQFEISATGTSVESSLGDDSDTLALTITLSTEENLNFESSFKK